MPPIVEYPDSLDFEIGGNANQVCPGISDNDNPEESLDTIDMNRLIRENNCRGRGYSFKILRGRFLYRKTNIANALMGVQIIGPALTQSEAPFHFDSTKGEDDDYTKINGELVNKFTGEVMQMPESEDSNQ